MQPGYADIADAVRGVAHEVERERGFFEHGQVTCACGGDYDAGVTGAVGFAVEPDAAGKLVVAQFGQAGVRGGELFGCGARAEDAGATLGEAHGDFADLFGGFARAEDDFGEAPTQAAVMVECGEADVLEGEAGQALQGGIDVLFACGDSVEEAAQ